MGTHSLSSGVNTTPFVWDYLGTSYEMIFYSGFMGVSQNPNTFALRPEIGWAVGDKTKMAQQTDT